MRKSARLLLVFILCLSIIVPAFPAKADAASTVVYFIPHADDETLSLAPDIINRIYQGYNVQMVLMSHGGASVARDIINGQRDLESSTPTGQVYCSIHARYHNPVTEKYGDGDRVDRTEFGQARVREFKDAVKAMGVPEQNIHIYNVEDGKFRANEAQIRGIYDEFLALYPQASFRTMSRWDYSDDHKFLGEVMYQYELEGKINTNQTIYFLSIYKARFDTNTTPIPVKVYKGFFYDPGDSTKVQNAINVYKRWDPVNKWYGIGYHSVKSQFDSLQSDMSIKYHYDN